MPATETTEVPGSGWSVAVIADEDEAWPLIAGKPSRSRSGQVRPTRMRPDLILLWISADGTVSARGSGIRVRRDGTINPDGGLRVDAPWREMANLPGWAAEMARGAVIAHGLRDLMHDTTETR